MTIPNTITVGYQNRTDTYTGKLGYVVYTDHKGVLRKESSWNSWRDKKIDSQTFDNIPTSGFVINKKVGETRYGWNPRMAWVRIYDPRGFEFEITVANLLFILEECTSTKGKELEGEFVYSWDRADLVLLPVTSQEYKQSSNFTNLQTKKITKDDMKDGRVYLNKKNEKVLYLGKLDYYTLNRDGDTSRNTSKKVHVFYNYESKYEHYWIQTGFTNIAEIVSEDISGDFAEKFDEYKKSFHGSRIVSFQVIEKENDLINKINEGLKKYSYSYNTMYCSMNNNKYIISSLHAYKRNDDIYYSITSNCELLYGFDNIGSFIIKRFTHHTNPYQSYAKSDVSKEFIDSIKLCDIIAITENGNKITISDY